jgi:PilZ domain
MVEHERRRVLRYPFIANAELVEERSDMRIATRVSELSLGGCYLDMMNPLPVGTLVRLKISTSVDFFEARAEILYSLAHPGGVGMRFIDVEPQYLAVLQGWLEKAEKDRLRRLS